ncbi:hypothetical protein TCAL_01337 [Tigriopus californicus]|uniref:THIF-type NAD/FAD binding fold domain-containing protein n=1 Tax=Tigriopus californicus TaxID=6832 RepID=A0A553PC86_TIGCA|nr:hypothetical protein TCAL_01337 [Tigriopus californicus]
MDKKFTEEEATLYDRQIRLWGLDAQKRLRNARILVCGMSGLGAEVAKNLVLAGVKSLTMLDQVNLTLEHCQSNFLAPRDQVSAEVGDVDAKDREYFKDFDIVLVTSAMKDTLIKVNGFCRDLGIKFLSGDVFGFFGYAFMDLVEHEFVEEVMKSSNSDLDADEPVKKRPKKDAEGEQEEEESKTKMVKTIMSFVPLEKSLASDWSQEAYKKRIKRMDPSFFVLHVLYEFQSREGRHPLLEHEEGDLKTLKSLGESITQKFNLPETKIPEAIYPMLFSEISPSAAIVGGILAQEIIKIISNRDAPHNNFFFFNPLETAGIVEKVGY